MFQVKKIKYKKIKKGNIKYNNHRNIILQKGIYGLKSLEYTRLTLQQLQSAHNILIKSLKKTGNIYVNIYMDVPVSKKPNGVRMGGYKGDINKWICKIKPGKILFELDNISKERAKDILKKASNKLPIKTKIVILKKF